MKKTISGNVVARLLSMVLTVALLTGCSENAAIPVEPESTAPDTAEEISTEAQDETSSAVTEDTTSEVAEEAAPETEESAQEEADSEETSTSEMDTSVMTPWINSNILGIVTDETYPDLKDDFYLNVNHDYLMNAKLRPGYPSETPFYDAADIVKERCLDILTDKTLDERDAKLPQSFYELFLDWDKRNEQGVEPIQFFFDDLKSISSLEELNELMLTETYFIYGNYLAGVYVGTNAEDSDLYDVEILSTTLSLGDSAEYKELTEVGKRKKTYNDGVSRYMLGRLGYSEEEIDKLIEDQESLETKIAAFEKTTLELSDPSALKESINPVTMEDLKDMSPNYPLTQIMEKFGYSKSKLINVSEPAWLTGLNEIYTEDNFDEIMAYVTVQAAKSFIEYVDEDAYRTSQKLSREYSGITESKSDEDSAYDMTLAIFSDNISRIYIKKYLNEGIKKEITQMCQDAINAYMEMFDTIDWLSEETREQAKYKLSKMTIHAVYPEKWKDDSMYFVTPKDEGGTYLQAMMDITKASYEENRSHINSKVDKELWDLNILSTNAYYNFYNNSINIIPGFFCDATYRSDMSIEEKYGALGTVIGHEISHAFDTDGAQFDAEGNLNNWWTEEDYAAFMDRADKLVKYYDGVVAFDDGTPIKGQIIQTEAIADMAGFKCMLSMAKNIDGFDYDKFFRANAKIWARAGTLSFMENCAVSDPHPLHYLRGNVTMQQFDEFNETYDIKEGDGMYLAPENRIAVW